jgi:hypothetical protein
VVPLLCKGGQKDVLYLLSIDFKFTDADVDVESEYFFCLVDVGGCVEISALVLHTSDALEPCYLFIFHVNANIFGNSKRDVLDSSLDFYLSI